MMASSCAAVPSRGRFINSGSGPTLQPVDIGHATHVAVVEPETAFWALVPREELAEALGDGDLLARYRERAEQFREEMALLRFGRQPSAVYLNATERCNLNCSYCYIPEEMRRHGQHMAKASLFEALTKLDAYFSDRLPSEHRPQIIFHGAEPLLNREAVFAAMTAFADRFRFGLQTNATLLDDNAIAFLTEQGCSIGLSLDAPNRATADQTRTTWAGDSVHAQVLRAMEKLVDYPDFNVIATVSTRNLATLTALVEFFHDRRVPACLLNVVRCTLPGSRDLRPDDDDVARHMLAALDRSHELFLATKRKLVVANFANVLLGIVAPTARRLMCDISPCGAGRCFFAVTPDGGMFPCSEFIGDETFRGGNLFREEIDAVLASEPFERVVGRRVEAIEPCRRCAIRPFCGAPCPAEAHALRGGMDRLGAYCGFYETQVRYAFRLIADGKEHDFLWDDWDRGTRTSF